MAWHHLSYRQILLHLLAGKSIEEKFFFSYFMLVNLLIFKRSIHPKQIEAINNDLENDRMIRALYDIKATDMGSQSVMFKAEVDIDGQQITRSYLEKIDIQVILDVSEKKLHNLLKIQKNLVFSMLGNKKD